MRNGGYNNNHPPGTSTRHTISPQKSYTTGDAIIVMVGLGAGTRRRQAHPGSFNDRMSSSIRPITKLTPTSRAGLIYKRHIDALPEATLLPLAKSWDNGANFPGKNHKVYDCVGGVSDYKREEARNILEEIECRGSAGFVQYHDLSAATGSSMIPSPRCN